MVLVVHNFRLPFVDIVLFEYFFALHLEEFCAPFFIQIYIVA